MLAIVDVAFEPLNIELTEPFGIATGAQQVAENVLVTLRLSDGSIGFGEAAPFPAVNGETQAHALAALEQARDALLGLDAERWRTTCEQAFASCPSSPSAGCALETAILDALCKSHGQSLWTFWGGREESLQTDITIPTGDVEHARQSAARALKRGFTRLKLKVGGGDLARDIARVRAICGAAPQAELILDANGGLDAPSALELLSELGPLKQRIALFEQPTPTEDIDALRQVRDSAAVPIAADESARTAADVRRLIRANCIDVINLKATKSGFMQALEMAQLAKLGELGLMVGGMVESQLCMTASACFAAGLGGFSFVDLDTPLFMRLAPVTGGYDLHGATLQLTSITRGHGVVPQH